MSFRRNGEKYHRWHQWVAAHRATLTEVGIPDWVWSDERRWICFLQEGGTDWESGWCVELLSPRQAEQFRAFILKEYDHEDYRCLLRSLQLVAERDVDD